jgi:hypothetical protein
MPCARQAKAPCVEVCESPQTTVMPGSVAPFSGADHMHDALALVLEREIGQRADFTDVGVQRLDLLARDRIGDALLPVRGRRVVVGRGDDGRNAPGLAPASLRPSKACGLVTSCTRWRSM